VQQEPAYDGKADIAGTLERISVQLSAKAKEATAAANAILTPFAPGPIEHLDAAANNVDPRYFHPTAPSARLAMRLAADRDGKKRAHARNGAAHQQHARRVGRWSESR
jgi:hypothetical protein